MKLWHFYFHVNEKHFPEEKVYKKLDNSKRYKWTTSFSGDFNYLTDFFSRHLELKLRKLKFEGNYKVLTIEIGKKYNIVKGNEGISIEIPFDMEKYKTLYPEPNLIPVYRQIHPVTSIDEFNLFLYHIVLEAFEFAKKQKDNDIPYEYLISELNEFKNNNYKREWYHQKKAFKEKEITARLLCKETCNEFTIELIVLKKRKEIFRQQIGKANPHYLIYRLLLGELKLWNNMLLVVVKYQDYKPIEKQIKIFELDLKKIIKE